MPSRDDVRPEDLESFAAYLTCERDGCPKAAAKASAAAADPRTEPWTKGHEERMAAIYTQYQETYRDVLGELEFFFPWLAPAECPDLVAAGKGKGDA
jgi:hypothetical protein